MNKQQKFTFAKGMNQDISKSKHPGDFYYDGNAIRIINTNSQSLHAVENEKGTTLEIELPSPTLDAINNSIIYGNKTLPFNNLPGNEIVNSDLPKTSGTQVIIGHTVTRDGIILFSTDNSGYDCIWHIRELLTEGYDLNLLYCRNLEFTIDNPIQALFNYENDNIQKVYWVDGDNQLRFLNIKHSIDNGDSENLIDVNANSINTVGDYALSQPILNEIRGGGAHTSGVVQYSYNLYKLNGSQTSLSPLSEQIQLDKQAIGGGMLNEIVGASPSLVIPELDNNYSHIKIYSIKYTSFNEVPEVALVHDSEIDSYTNYIFTDNGIKISTLTLAEFAFLGSNPLVPRHIQSKDNRMFAANLKDTAFQFEIDTRAYSFNQSGVTKLYTGNVQYLAPGSLQGNFSEFLAANNVVDYNYLATDDAINPSFDEYKYQRDTSTIGGEGIFIKYSIVQKTLSQLTGDIKYNRFFKDNEIYRLGIQFYNKLGQYTEVKWIADFKAPVGNLNGRYNTLEVELIQPALQTYIDSLNLPANEQPVGYKIVRAERTNSDKTILCQGVLNGMMIQSTIDPRNASYWHNDTNKNSRSKDFVKIPSLFSRGFEPLPKARSVHANRHLQHINTKGPYGRNHGDSEIYAELARDFKVQQSWQYNKMYQMFSPEITFDRGITFGAGLKFSIRGLASHTQTNAFKQIKSISSNQFVSPSKRVDTDTYQFGRDNDRSGIHNLGIFGPRYRMCSKNIIDYYLYNDQYYNFVENTNDNSDTTPYPIYGSPEINERGSGVSSYNNDDTYQYANTLESVISDGFNDAGCCCGGCDDEASIQGINSWGARSVMIVEGDADKTEDDRLSLRDLLGDMSDNTSINGLIISEIKRPESYVYGTGIYGGLSNESKARSSYVEIGEYRDITIPNIVIDSPGDTYVQPYKVARISKTDTEVLNCRIHQLTNIIECNIETTINLLNRSDSSLLAWDNKFQPRYDEYHNYNTVYSQESNLLRRNTDSLTARKVNKFDTRVMSSKIKTPNETVDSWTDFLENEVLDLDGKYGAVNSLINVKDEIYALQDSAVAHLSINPRVQTQSSDGVTIELGRGDILYDYNYLTTKSGTLNKWSVTESPNSFYYLDLINKSYMRMSAHSGISNVSDKGGMHSYFQNNLNVEDLIVDNPIIAKGVVGGYDVVNGDAFVTTLQGDKSFTLRYNEKNDAFHSFEPYTPSRYINKGDILLSTHPDNNKIHSHYTGKYNEFHDEHHPSYITLLVNPEADVDCTFNNINYKSEAYVNDINQPLSTLTHYQAWNEHQDTGRVELVLGRSKNLRRKYTNWAATIARNRDSRDRIRNPWMFLKLELDKSDNTKFILHDIIIGYNS